MTRTTLTHRPHTLLSGPSHRPPETADPKVIRDALTDYSRAWRSLNMGRRSPKVSLPMTAPTPAIATPLIGPKRSAWNKAGLPKYVYPTPTGKYVVRMRVGGEMTHVGTFDTVTEAQEALREKGCAL